MSGTRHDLFLYICEMPIIAHKCLNPDVCFSHTHFKSGTQVSVSGTRPPVVFAPRHFHCRAVRV